MTKSVGLLLCAASLALTTGTVGRAGPLQADFRLLLDRCCVAIAPAGVFFSAGSGEQAIKACDIS